MSDSFLVRDKRNAPWFWMDNAIISEYLVKMGVYGFAVYGCLVMHSRNGSTFVGQQTIAKEVGCSPTKVKEAIALLMQLELVAVESGKETGQPNRYWLLAIPEPKREDCDGHDDVVFLPGGKVVRGGGVAATRLPLDAGVATERLPPRRNTPTGSSDSAFPILSNKTNKNEKTKNKETGYAIASQSLPEWIDAEAWDGFVAMRNKLRKPMTPRASELIIRKLERFRSQGMDVNAILDQSTVKGWQDVFELKGDHGGSYGANVSNRTAINRAAANEVFARIDAAESHNEGGGVYGGSDGRNPFL